MIDLTTFQYGMNVLFPKLNFLVASKSRLFRLFKKRYNFKGEKVLWRPVVEAANGSNTFTDSSTYAAGPEPLEARFSFKRDYAHVKLDSEVLLASQGDGASMSAQEAATKAALMTHALQVKLQIIRNGGNSRGQVLSGEGTATITLKNKEDACFFLPGMWVYASSDDGAQAAPAGLRNGGAAVQIGKVNLAKGQLTNATGGNWTAVIGALTADDHLFRRGDYGAAAPNGFFGLDAWFPTSDPGASDSYGGINRSTAPDKLAGMRVDVTGNLLTGIFDVLAEREKNMDEEKTSTSCILSVTRANDLMKSVQSQGRYEPGDAAKFGASSFVIATPWGGKCNIVAEAGMRQDRFYIGEPDSFEIIARQGDIPHWFNSDGREWRHLGSSDSIEAFIQSFLCTLCPDPSKWAIGNIT